MGWEVEMFDCGKAKFVHGQTPNAAPPRGKVVEQYYAVVTQGL